MDYRQLIEDVFYVMLYGGVTMSGVVAAFYLLFRKANAIAPEVTSPIRLRRWTAAFLLAVALSHVWWIVGVIHPLAKDSMTSYLMLCFMDLITVFPAMMGTLLAMLQDRKRAFWPVCLSLLPVVVLLVFCFFFHKNNALLMITHSCFLLLIALFILYMVFAVRRYGRWLQDNYADLEHKEIRQSLLVLAVFLIFFAMYESVETGGRAFAYLLQVDVLVLTGLLLWRVETLQELKPDTIREEEPADAAPIPASTGIPANIGPLLEANCESRQLYLQHDLSLAQLSQAIGTNHSYLSKYFAQQGLTYNAYINGLRIRHFMRLYDEAVASRRLFTAQQLAYESGFHSYSTFSAAFKQNTGKTVTAWMRDSAK